MKNSTPFPKLETHNLILRRMTHLDSRDLFAIRKDPRMNEYTDTKLDESIEETKSYIDKMNKGNDNIQCYVWGIEHKQSNKVIGSICIWNMDKNKKFGELGYGIMPDYQRQGFMKEALSEVVTYAFLTLDLAYLDAYTEKNNLPSITLLEKCNFIEIDSIDEEGRFTSQVYHMVVFRLQNKRRVVDTLENKEYIESVYLDDQENSLVLLDQTLLPGQEIYIKISTPKEIWEAIFKLQVRGAPAIGIAAAYGLYIIAKHSCASTPEELAQVVGKNKAYLETSRPTAVNLAWALHRMENCFAIAKEKGASYEELLKVLKKEAHAIRKEDENVCQRIGEHALSLLEPDFGLLTHCNAGSIATARYGTALAPIYLGQEKGYHFKVFADETRPLLQGSRLTAWELERTGIDVTLICDNMAATVMSQGKVDAILVGCDRVAANGDTANKIGTMNVAILAKYFNIPFYICAPKSTIDMNCKNAEDIKIEIRPNKEITETWFTERMAPKNIKTYNPAFDITDHSLITAIITEDKIIYPPFKENIALLMEG